jgi:hypothetical protein
MNLIPINDNNSSNQYELADDGNIGKLTPHCLNHRAMNKVSKFKNGGYWRCLQYSCRVGCIEVINNQ